MNIESIVLILCRLLEVEGLLLLTPAAVSLVYREKMGFVYLILGIICFVIGFIASRFKIKKQIFYAKEGFVVVSLGWILMSLVGCLPFVLTGEIPSFTDAFFETVSGFTTTGSSILTDVEALSHCSLFWRSFTHWIGGMGVFVFMLAVLPMTGAQNMHLMRSESPGPEVGKLVPKLKESAKILYIIYFAMTVAEIIILLISGMAPFDSITLSFGTAGTGGFGVRNSSIADYTYLQQLIIGIFMVLFGINFNFYFFLFLRRSLKEAFRMDEVRTYLGIIAVSVIVIMIDARHLFNGVADGFIKAFFQVSSIITTTGYATADFDTWPALSKTVIFTLMFIGACAGSTGGGFKISRIIIAVKSHVRKIKGFIHPRLVQNVYLDGRKLKEETVSGVSIYTVTYILIIVASLLLVSMDEFDLETNITAVAATLNNIGPGFSTIGPTCNFSAFSPFVKYVLCFDMLAGRLELFPMLILFAPSTWRKR